MAARFGVVARCDAGADAGSGCKVGSEYEFGTSCEIGCGYEVGSGCCNTEYARKTVCDSRASCSVLVNHTLQDYP